MNQNRIDILIVLGSGPNQLPFILKSKKLGLMVLVIDQNPDTPGFNQAYLSILLSTYDTDLVIEKLRSLEKKYKYIGLIARSSGPALKTAARISETFNLNGLTSEIVPIATEKAMLRLFCESHNLKMPAGQRVTSHSEWLSPLPYPLIVKPDFPIVGKQAIRLVENKKALETAIDDACQASYSGYAEIEAFIPGIDVSVLFHLNGGKSVPIAFWDELNVIGSDHRVRGLGESIPSVVVGTEVQSQIEETINRFGKYFGNVTGLLILSFRIDMDDNISIIELHADLGGDLIADKLMPAANPDFDFYEMAINVACGHLIPTTHESFTPVAMLFPQEERSENASKNLLDFVNPQMLYDSSISGLHQQLEPLYLRGEMLHKPLHHDWLNAYMDGSE